MPHDTLRRFLENEVLSKYTYIFQQHAENASPIENIDIQTWIRQILSEMQSGIEEHINTAMKSNK